MPLRAPESETADVSEPGRRRACDPVADGGGSLPVAEDRRYLRRALRRRLGKPAAAISKIIADTKLPANIAHQHARAGGDHADLVPEFRHWTDSGDSAGVSDPGRAVCFVHRSISDRAGRANRAGRRNSHAGAHRNHAQHSIADGNRDAARHGGFQQHPDRGLRQRAARRRAQRAWRRSRMPAAFACGRS